jgi:single-strand DNA-binding protein
MSVNKVILVGRLGKDPEVRFTGGGQAVANFSVATDESFKDRSGERQKRTEWHRIVAWGKQAEFAQKYLKKGGLIYLEGRIQSREWQDKENQKRYITEVIASDFRFIGGRQDGAQGGAAEGGGGGAQQRGGYSTGQGSGGGGGAHRDVDFEQGVPDEPASGGGPEISDEDIPF